MLDFACISAAHVMSPSLRGSGLKSNRNKLDMQTASSPSLRGSGLKSPNRQVVSNRHIVSLFTREWIEMTNHPTYCQNHLRLPLYEGVD